MRQARTRRIYLGKCPACGWPLAGIFPVIYHRPCDAEAKATHEARVSRWTLDSALASWREKLSPNPVIVPVAPPKLTPPLNTYDIQCVPAHGRPQARLCKRYPASLVRNLAEVMAVNPHEAVSLSVRDMQGNRLLWWGPARAS